MEKRIKFGKEAIQIMGHRFSPFVVWVQGALCLLLGLCLIRMSGPLLFQTVLQLGVVALFWAVLVITWIGRETIRNGAVLLLGIALPFGTIPDLAAVLSNLGVSPFGGLEAALTTPFRVAAGILHALTFLAAPFALGRRIPTGAVTIVSGIVAVALTAAVLAGIAPPETLHIPGTAPSPGIGGYPAVFISSIALGLLFRCRRAFLPSVGYLVMGCAAATVLSDLSFAAYPHIFGAGETAGLLLKILAAWFLLGVAVEGALREPRQAFLSDLKHRETERDRSREALISLAQAAPLPIFFLDREAKVTLWNRQAEQAFGWSLEEVAGTSPPFLPDDREGEFRSALQRATEGEPLTGLELKCVRKDGKGLDVDLSLVPTRDGSGEVTGFIGIMIDQGEKRRRECTLLGSELRYRSLVEALPCGVLHTDADGACVFVNSRWEQITGCPQQEALGEGWMGCIHPDDRRPVIRDWQEAIRTGKEFPLKFRCRKPSGEVSWVEGVAVPIRIDGNETAGYIASIMDVSLQKRAEEAVQESERKYRALFENAPDAIFVADAKSGFLVDANPRALALAGRSLETIRTMHFTELHPPEDRLKAATRFQQGRVAPDSLQVELKVLHRDGSLTPVEVRSGGLLGAAGRELFFGVFRNTASRSEAEENDKRIQQELEGRVCARMAELEQANEELRRLVAEREQSEEQVRLALQREKELHEMKTTFISIASHEFRTPMTAALGSAELLRDFLEKFTPEKRRELADRIVISVQRVCTMLDDVLTISRLDRGKITWQPAPTNLTAFVRQLVDEARMSDGGRHVFSVEVEGEGEDILADANILKQALDHVISNAMQYSPDGSRIVVRAQSDLTTATLVIEDEGRGIPESDLERLFRPFERGSNAGDVRGAGLGLTVAKRMVELHGGSISLSSTLGSGTCVSIRVPIKRRSD